MMLHPVTSQANEALCVRSLEVTATCYVDRSVALVGGVGVAQARGVKIDGHGQERKVHEFPILFGSSVVS